MFLIPRKMCLYSTRYQCTNELGENDLSISIPLTLSPVYSIAFINNLAFSSYLLLYIHFCYNKCIRYIYHCKSILSLSLKVHHSLSNGTGLVITYHPSLLLYQVIMSPKLLGQMERNFSGIYSSYKSHQNIWLWTLPPESINVIWVADM